MNKAEMIDEIVKKLKLVNIGVIKPESIDDNKMDELTEIYENGGQRTGIF